MNEHWLRAEKHDGSISPKNRPSTKAIVLLMILGGIVGISGYMTLTASGAMDLGLD